MGEAWYRWFPGDYMKDTGHLTLVQHGAYHRLLDAYYAKGLPLPESLDALARIAGAHSKAEREAVTSVAGEFFPVGEDGLRHNARADRELCERTEYGKAQAMRAHMRWQSKGNANASALAMQTDMPPQPQPQPHKETTRTTSSSAGKPTDAGMRLAEHLLAEIRFRVPDSRQPNLVAWAKEFDRLMRIDGRSEVDAVDLVTWVQSDPFWGPNAMSPAKIREHWDRLVLKRKADSGAGPGVACSAAQRDKYAHLEEPC